MTARMETYLWLSQRLSAAVLAVCIVVHIVTMLFAVQNGLTGKEITDRLIGAPGWMVFYGIFVLSVAVHAPLGLRNIFIEMTNLSRRAVAFLSILVAVMILGFGMQAVLGLYGY